MSASDLHRNPELATDMFQDRRIQFCEELGWDLHVDYKGNEIDNYDLINPLYIIMHNEKNQHIGSGRFLPTTGRTMLSEHFSYLIDDHQFNDELIWEVTRIFLSSAKSKSPRDASTMLFAGCLFGLRAGLKSYVSVTAYQMTKVFAACGWSAEIIGRELTPHGELCACIWTIDEATCAKLANRSQIKAKAARQLELLIECSGFAAESKKMANSNRRPLQFKEFAK